MVGRATQSPAGRCAASFQRTDMRRISDPLELLIAGLRDLGPLSDAAEAEVRQLPMEMLVVAPRHDILKQGDRLSECCLIVDGIFVRHTTLRSGQRQILSIHLPRDIPDLHGLAAPATDFSLGALTPARAAFIRHADLHSAMTKAPDLGVLLWRLTLSDAAMLRARLVSVGTRPAYQRVAHFFCETFVRMRALGLADETSFMLPLTQSELGSALGLSAVHVNRTLQQLRRDGVITSRGRYHVFADWRRLREAGDFDEGYLFPMTGQSGTSR
jgi:CRP-like cAMP-binding protein